MYLEINCALAKVAVIAFHLGSYGKRNCLANVGESLKCSLEGEKIGALKIFSQVERMEWSHLT